MFEHEYTAQLILRRMNTDHYSIEYILLSLQSDSNTCSAVKSDVWTWIHSTADSETHERRSLQHRVHPSVFTERLKHMFCWCKHTLTVVRHSGFCQAHDQMKVHFIWRDKLGADGALETCGDQIKHNYMRSRSLQVVQFMDTTSALNY